MFRATNDGAGKGMFTCDFNACGKSEQFIRSNAVCGQNVGDFGLAAGQRARLVEGHGMDRGCAFQCFDIADQNSGARCRTRSCDERCGRGEAERARAGNHQHGDGCDHGRFEAIARNQPASESHGGNDENDRHEYGRDAVHQLLNRRLPGLGLLDEPCHAGKAGIVAGGGHFHGEHAIGIGGAGHHHVAGFASHRQAFARYHGLIE